MTQCGLQTWIYSQHVLHSPSGNTNGKNNMQCTYNILNFFNNVFIFICFLHSHVRTPESEGIWILHQHKYVPTLDINNKVC